MSDNGIITAKGIYRYPTPDRFIAVKQYMFVRRDGKKHLILRYVNESDTHFESVRFQLTEMNADGTVLNTRKIFQGKLNAAPGETFAPNEGIPISDECVDFKIKFIEATSEQYVYRVRGKRVCVYYAEKNIRARVPSGTPAFSVKTLGSPRSRTMAVFALTALIAFTVLSLAFSYVSYMKGKYGEYWYNRILGEPVTVSETFTASN